MSILPILAGLYVASLFIKFPFSVSESNLTMVSLISLVSLGVSFAGYFITKQMVMPLAEMSTAAQNIAEGNLDSSPENKEGAAAKRPRNTDEFEELSRSLRTISKNARELLDRVEKLSLKDKLTGLYNATYIRERLDEEIQRAIHYQRPCSFAYFLVDRLDSYQEKKGKAAAEGALKTAAEIFNQHITEFARAARIGPDEFVIIFPDKNKKNTIEIVEKIHAELASLFPEREEGEPVLEVFAGVSENPIDGVQADELFIKARDRMEMARTGHKNLEAFA